MLRRSAISATGLMLLVTAAPATAQGPGGGLAFRDVRPLTAKLADLDSVQMVVCNVGRATARGLAVTQTGFAFTHDGEALDDADVLSRPRLVRGRATAHVLKPGACAEIHMGARFGAATDSGSFTGEMVAVSAGQGIARRDVTITGPVDSAVPAASVADTVKLKVVQGYGPLHGLLGDDSTSFDVVLAEPPAGKTLDIAATCGGNDAKPSQACPGIGVVAHDDDTGQFVLAGRLPDPEDGVVRLPVRFNGAPVVGDYSGTIDPGLSGEDANAIKVIVGVTHGWWWALGALLLGCALVIVPQLWTRRWKPMSKFHERADLLLERYASAEAAFRGPVDPGHFPQILRPTDAEIRNYGDEVKTAFDNYLRSMVYLDTDTVAYREIEKSLTTAGDDVACWADPAALRKSLAGLAAALDALQTWLRERKFAATDPEVAKTAAGVLAGRRLKIGEAMKVRRDADGAIALLEDWRMLAESTLTLQLWWRELALKAVLRPPLGMTEEDAERHARVGARLAQAKSEMLQAKDADVLDHLGVRRRVDGIYGDLAYLGGRYGVDRPRVNDAPHELQQLWATLGLSGEVKSLLMLPPPQLQITSAALLIEAADGLQRRPAKPAGINRTWRWLGDVACIGIAISVALIAALAAIVNGKNFGSVEDYLTVIVLGTAAQGVVSGVIPTINSALSDRFGTVLETPAAPATAIVKPVSP